MAVANRGVHPYFAAHLAGRVALVAHRHAARSSKLHVLLSRALCCTRLLWTVSPCHSKATTGVGLSCTKRPCEALLGPTGTVTPLSRHTEQAGWSEWTTVIRPALLSCTLFFFSSRRRHTRLTCDWSSDVCSSDLTPWSTTSYGASSPSRPRSIAADTAHNGAYTKLCRRRLVVI